MKKYEAYKDSGIEWIGEIPEEWEKIRLAFTGKFSKGSGVSKADLSEDGFPVVLYGDIYTKYDLSTNRLQRFISKEVAESATKIKNGDLLLTASGETKEDIGKCLAYTGDAEAYAGGDVIILTPKKFNSLFLSYVLNSEKVRWEKAKMSRGEIVVHIYSSILRDIFIPFPSFHEQATIANYLDQKTSQLNKLIAKKERLIELLQEERTAIVNHAITKGLDSNVPMKDSGIDWLGEIPEHWEVRKNAWLFSEVDERGFPDLPILQVSINTGVTLRDFSEDKIQPIMNDLSDYKMATKGYLAFNKMRMWQGAVGVSPVNGLISPDYTVAKPKENVNTLFYSRLFRTEMYKIQIDRFSRGIAKDRNRLYWDGFREIQSVFPPVSEQNEIVKFIESEELRIGTLILKIQNEIELIQEYKIALISDVVTGKVDVRNEILN